MHDRLIVGFDGSLASLAALRWAGEEAESRKASVRVISSYSMPPVMDYYGIGTAAASTAELERLEQACESALRDAVAEATRCHPTVGFDYRATSAPPVRCLVDEAAAADLLVVGSNGLGAIKSFILGSVTGAVLHDSRCPVVVVPEQLRDSVGRIVVGVDGSKRSDVALRWAEDEADRRGCTLVVVHAWEYPYRMTEEGFARGSTLAEVDASIVLERAVDAATDRMSSPVIGELAEGSATQALLDAAEQADLLVVGSRGRGGFRSMILGSVAHAVSAHASCPVAVVR